MCDYSLYNVRTRAAKVGNELTTPAKSARHLPVRKRRSRPGSIDASFAPARLRPSPACRGGLNDVRAVHCDRPRLAKPIHAGTGALRGGRHFADRIDDWPRGMTLDEVLALAAKGRPVSAPNGKVEFKPDAAPLLAAASFADIRERALIAAADLLGVRTRKGLWWIPKLRGLSGDLPRGSGHSGNIGLVRWRRRCSQNSNALTRICLISSAPCRLRRRMRRPVTKAATTAHCQWRCARPGRGERSVCRVRRVRARATRATG